MPFSTLAVLSLIWQLDVTGWGEERDGEEGAGRRDEFEQKLIL